MPGRLEVTTGGGEVGGRTTAGPHGVGLTAADRVNVQSVEARRQDSADDGLHGHGGIAIAEVDSGVGDVLAVGSIQLGGQLLRTRPR